ncbi:sigma-70 family RNA polymerase sigma factor [Microbacterium sp. USTB-Y]|uniref:sigma-70 family RNA polymerase sigma factor n=1 Tax=Microbacterium sp. USTB-Y TaxID=2823692 RepID=UPI00203FC13D|nr:sigma-70 family RNA polymerase sigma factor [Microbacterium sp. USTB-Y]
MVDSRTDAELLSSLRAGDNSAYEVLWHRHAPAAHRYAQRLLPARAEDLVSESFLAIYQQVTTTDAGPQFAFRSYLKAVLRNTAIRWRKDAEQFVDVEAEPADERDALSIAEQDSEATDVLAALQALPERWQRVLWLAEVVEAGRPQIAQELQIRPNAVSALQRRARAGLKFQWLTRQIPLDLRDDPSHAARLFPQYLTETGGGALAVEVSRHVADCRDCADLLIGLRGAASRLQRNTLAVLLGSAGVGTASATLSSGTTAAALAVVAGGATVSWLIGGGVAAVTAGSLIISSLFTVGPADAAPDRPVPSSTQAEAPQPAPSGPQAGATSDAGEPAPAEIPAVEGDYGRHVDDPGVPVIDFTAAQPAPRPDPPAPATGPGTPSPGTETQPALSPGLTTPTTASGYAAPIIAGRTQPGNAIAVEFDSGTYLPTVADDGSWSYDLRQVVWSTGTYDYRVWAYDATAQGAPSTGSFTVLPVAVRGFEGMTGVNDMTTTEATSTGIVITLNGPANGNVLLSLFGGNTATIALDGNGQARGRILMKDRGFYSYSVQMLYDDGVWGPEAEAGPAVGVYDAAHPDAPMPRGVPLEFTLTEP